MTLKNEEINNLKQQLKLLQKEFNELKDITEYRFKGIQNSISRYLEDENATKLQQKISKHKTK